MTFNDMRGHTLFYEKSAVRIHRNFYQNQFINKYAKKKKLKSRNLGVTKFFSEI